MSNERLSCCQMNIKAVDRYSASDENILEYTPVVIKIIDKSSDAIAPLQCRTRPVISAAFPFYFSHRMAGNFQSGPWSAEIPGGSCLPKQLLALSTGLVRQFIYSTSGQVSSVCRKLRIGTDMTLVAVNCRVLLLWLAAVHRVHMYRQLHS